MDKISVTTEPTMSQPPVTTPPTGPGKRWLWWALGLVILLAIGVGVWWMRRPSNIPAPSVTTSSVTTPSATDTSITSWKTYEGTPYAVNFKYPPTWQLSDETQRIKNQQGSLGANDQADVLLKIIVSDPAYESTTEMIIPHNFYLMIVPKKASNKSLSEWLTKRFRLPNTELEDYQVGSTVKVGGYSGYQSSIGCCASHDSSYAIEHNDLVYFFGSNGFGFDSKVKNPDYFNQIVDTITFTQPAASSINKDIEKVDFSKIISVNTKIGDALETPVYADLNSDNSEEALVVYRYSGTANGADFYIYGMKDGSPVKLLKDSGNGEVEIKNSSVYFHVTDPNSAVNKGKSNVDMVAEYFKYTWNGSTFAKSGQ